MNTEIIEVIESNSRWELYEGIQECQNLARFIKEFGYYPALTGSVLYHGSSQKDLDILVYPHHAPSPVMSFADLWLEIIKYYNPKAYGFAGTGKAYEGVRYLIKQSEQRIDFFFCDFITEMDKYV